MKEKQQDKKENKRRKWLFLLLLLFLMTGLIVLLILGSTAVELPFGTLPPTVVVSTPTPQEEAEPDELPLSISIKMETSAGNAYAGGIVELHSDPKISVTDQDGLAFFYDVEEGEHTVYAKSASGLVLASAVVEIVESELTDELIISGDSTIGYYIEIPVRVAVLEVKFVIVGTSLLIDHEETAVVTFDNQFINNDDTYTASEYNIMTTAGNIVATTGEIIIPGVGVVLGDGTFVYNSETETIVLDSGISILTDGTICFPDGMMILPDGTIVLSTGKESYASTDDGIYFSNDELEQLSDWISLPSGATTTDTTDTSYKDIIIGDDGVWIEEVEGEGITVDIFENENIIYPGSSGEYVFNVYNPNSDTFSCVISLFEESEIYLPLEYTIKYSTNQSADISEYETLSGEYDFSGGVYSYATDAFSISKYSYVYFVLEWKWEFESTSEYGGDSVDTAVGSVETAEELTHEITISVYAEMGEDEEQDTGETE